MEQFPVDQLLELAVARWLTTRPDLKLGI